MPSPFPGMNPYLERESSWHDFHGRFLVTASDLLNRQILPNYFAKFEEHVFVEDADDDSRRVLGVADLAVTQSAAHTVRGGGLQATTSPVEVRQNRFEVERLHFLEIRDRDGQSLVSVLELLSPTNKRYGKSRDQYIGKREEYLESNAHFIEIDLLRGGPRLPWLDMVLCDYYAVVSRVENRPRAAFWPIGLRDRLPEIPIPLRPGDADARLDLQAVLNQVYDAAWYAYSIYQHAPEPPLTAEDDAWVAEIVTSSAHRT